MEINNNVKFPYERYENNKKELNDVGSTRRLRPTHIHYYGVSKRIICEL